MSSLKRWYHNGHFVLNIEAMYKCDMELRLPVTYEHHRWHYWTHGKSQTCFQNWQPMVRPSPADSRSPILSSHFLLFSRYVIWDNKEVKWKKDSCTKGQIKSLLFQGFQCFEFHDSWRKRVQNSGEYCIYLYQFLAIVKCRNFFKCIYTKSHHESKLWDSPYWVCNASVFLIYKFPYLIKV